MTTHTDPETGRFIAAPRPVPAADIAIGEVVHIDGTRRTLAAWDRPCNRPVCRLTFTDGGSRLARFEQPFMVERAR